MTKKYIFIISFFLSVFSINAETIEQYYSSAEGKSGASLKNALHIKISDQVVLSYGDVWNALKTTDEDPDNANNVILLYSGWSYPKNNNGGGTTQWNREHTWAKSKGNFGTSKGPGTDIHHLRPTDVTVNSKRGSLIFDDGGTNYTDASRYGGGSGATGCKYDGDSWEPRDEVKGDVARMLFYMAVRYEAGDKVDLELAEYNSNSGLHGKLSTLLEWHVNDPVDQWEIDRNEKIYAIQGNRNPFINHPEYVDKIWGSGAGDVDPTDPDDGTDEYIELFSEDFETSTLGKMTSHNIIGNDLTWNASNYHDKKFAKMSGYANPGYSQNEDWLINTSAIDLSSYTNLTLSFTTEMKVYQNNTTFEVYVSSDYDGTSNPNDFIWTDITNQANYSNDNYNQVASGDIDLSSWSNNSIYVAFKFENTASGSNTWQLDNILVKGKELANSMNAPLYNEVDIYPNPASSEIYISSQNSFEIDEIRIFNQSGQNVRFLSTYEYGSPINLNELKNGLYYVQILNTTGKTVTKKIMVR